MNTTPQEFALPLTTTHKEAVLSIIGAHCGIDSEPKLSVREYSFPGPDGKMTYVADIVDTNKSVLFSGMRTITLAQEETDKFDDAIEAMNIAAAKEGAMSDLFRSLMSRLLHTPALWVDVNEQGLQVSYQTNRVTVLEHDRSKSTMTITIVKLLR